MRDAVTLVARRLGLIGGSPRRRTVSGPSGASRRGTSRRAGHAQGVEKLGLELIGAAAIINEGRQRPQSRRIAVDSGAELGKVTVVENQDEVARPVAANCLRQAL